MKTGIKTAAILATVFAGTLVVEAQQQKPKQRQGAGKPTLQCPNCGWQPQSRQQRQTPPPNAQFQQQRGNAQFQGQQQGVPTPQQRQQALQRRQQYLQQSGRGNAAQFQGRQQSQRPQLNQQQRQQALQRRQQFMQQSGRGNAAQFQGRPQGQRPPQLNQQQRRNPVNQGSAQVQGRQGQARGQKNPEMAKRREQILKRFDADNDGQLSEKERKTAKKAWKQHQKSSGNKAEKKQHPKAAE